MKMMPKDVKCIDEAYETHAVTGRWRLVIQIVSGNWLVRVTAIAIEGIVILVKKFNNVFAVHPARALPFSICVIN
eukprot:Em0027g11a